MLLHNRKPNYCSIFMIMCNIKRTALCLLLLVFSLSFAETYSKAYLESLIGDGYTIASNGIAEGNLNFDDYIDVILVLDIVEPTETNIETRPLGIFFGQEDGSLLLYKAFSKVNYCQSCGGAFGDPFDGTVIDNGTFTVSDYGGSAWRWFVNRTFSFNPEDNRFYLEEFSEAYYNSYTTSEIDLDTLNIETWTSETFGAVTLDEFDTDTLESYKTKP